jgi:hypothetical protein
MDTNSQQSTPAFVEDYPSGTVIRAIALPKSGDQEYDQIVAYIRHHEGNVTSRIWDHLGDKNAYGPYPHYRAFIFQKMGVEDTGDEAALNNLAKAFVGWEVVLKKAVKTWTDKGTQEERTGLTTDVDLWLGKPTA